MFEYQLMHLNYSQNCCLTNTQIHIFTFGGNDPLWRSFEIKFLIAAKSFSTVGRRVKLYCIIILNPIIIVYGRKIFLRIYINVKSYMHIIWNLQPAINVLCKLCTQGKQQTQFWETHYGSIISIHFLCRSPSGFS